MKSIKSKYLFIPIVTLIVILFSSGCEKIPFDKRNKFIGKWDFDVVIDEFNMATGYTFHDEVSYAGSIKYGDADDEIVIQYTENL